MEIEVTISTDSLGRSNTTKDNNQYIDAVLGKIQSEYPGWRVSVILTTVIGADFCWVSDDPTGKIEDNVKLIVQQVWEKEDF